VQVEGAWAKAMPSVKNSKNKKETANPIIKICILI
jgi:hypothetical protein